MKNVYTHSGWLGPFPVYLRLNDNGQNYIYIRVRKLWLVELGVGCWKLYTRLLGRDWDSQVRKVCRIRELKSPIVVKIAEKVGLCQVSVQDLSSQNTEADE